MNFLNQIDNKIKISWPKNKRRDRSIKKKKIVIQVNGKKEILYL